MEVFGGSVALMVLEVMLVFLGVVLVVLEVGPRPTGLDLQCRR